MEGAFGWGTAPTIHDEDSPVVLLRVGEMPGSLADIPTSPRPLPSPDF